MKTRLAPHWIFILLTFVMTGALYPVVLTRGTQGLGAAFAVLAIYAPAICGIATLLICRIPIQSIGWRPGGLRALIAGIAISALYLTLGYIVIWGSGIAPYAPEAFFAGMRSDFGLSDTVGGARLFPWLLLYLTLQLAVSMVLSLGEEIGWRGVLVPLLAQRYRFVWVALLSGMAWGLWHFPLVIFDDHAPGTPVLYRLACFSVLIVAVSFGYAWIRLKSGSVWPAVIMHAAHNALLNDVLGPFTGTSGQAKWAVGETGWVLAVVAVGLAFVTLRAAPRLPAPPHRLGRS